MATHSSDKTLDRRGFLASTAAGAAVMTAAPTALGKLAQGGGLTAGTTLGGGWQISEICAVEALHAQGVIHCNLAPSKFLRRRSGRGLVPVTRHRGG